MTGAPVPDRRRRGRALRVDRPRRRAGPHRRRRPSPGQHVRPAGEDVAEGDLLHRGGHRRSAPRHLGLLAGGRPGRRSRPDPRPRVVVISTGSELREPGDGRSATTRSTTATPTCSRPRRPRGRRDRLPGRHRPRRAAGVPRRARATSWSAPTSWSPAAASRRATTTSSRRRCAATGTSGSAAVAMQPGKPQGFGVGRRGRDPDLHAAGQPGLVVHLLRDVRAAGDPPDDGPGCRTPGRLLEARLTHGDDVARRAGASSCAARYGVDARRPVRHAGRRPGLAPDRRPGAGQRLIVVPERHHRRSTPGDLVHGAARWTGSSDGGPMATEDRLTHVDETGAARMVDVSGKDVTARTATATGRVLVSAQVVDAAARRGRAQGRRARPWPGSPGSWAPSRRPR